MQFNYPEGATPLTYDEIYNLLPKHITLQSELDEWENFNIIRAEQWAYKIKRKDILSIKFTKQLHKKMFDKTWKWAGEFRKTQTNIGYSNAMIGIELEGLFRDVIYQINNEVYPIREIAVRLHHRAVLIHPFPNGNGRFSRLLVDVFLHLNNERKFTWGSGIIGRSGETRTMYLDALRAADNADYSKLIGFVDC